MPCFTREDFLRKFVVPVDSYTDFERAGVAAQFASGHPRDWTQEYEVLDFAADIKQDEGHSRKSYYTAVSSDKKLLAISTRSERILVHDIASKELRSVLEGVGSVAFRPSAPILKDAENTGQGRIGAGYMLLILWDLDQHGRILDQEEPIDPAAFATKAIDAIAPELATSHEMTRDFIDASALAAQFTKALNEVAADHRRRHNTVIDNATFGAFSSTFFSYDGKYMLYHTDYRATQRGLRAPENLPQVVIYDLEAGKEAHRLAGHMDAIMWSAFSPDSEYVASVSWDGTLRMYSASNGRLEWASEDSGGQSWTGAFSPNSRFIAWSSKSGRNVQVHEVTDGLKTSTCKEKFSDWCRCLEWHPTRSELAMCAGKTDYIWDLSDDADGRIVQHYTMDDDKSWLRMRGVQSVGWMDEGRLLYVELSEGTKLIYNTESNAKELFRRPMGVHAGYVKGGFYGVSTKDEQDFYLSIDGDGKARYWRTSIAAHPSWWEKESSAAVAEKKPFPGTGKYVKITKKAKAAEQEDPRKETWAERGAALWTAE